MTCYVSKHCLIPLNSLGHNLISKSKLFKNELCRDLAPSLVEINLSINTNGRVLIGFLGYQLKFQLISQLSVNLDPLHGPKLLVKRARFKVNIWPVIKYVIIHNIYGSFHEYEWYRVLTNTKELEKTANF